MKSGTEGIKSVSAGEVGRERTRGNREGKVREGREGERRKGREREEERRGKGGEVLAWACSSQPSQLHPDVSFTR